MSTQVAPSRYSFGGFVAMAHQAGELVVQPRMGMSSPSQMRRGLIATKYAAATTVGTITLDSYTRVGDHRTVIGALSGGVGLNGYPIVAHPPATTRAVLDGVMDGGFPVQVRHGSAHPQEIFAALISAGMHATEGGPVSYCLPYSRTPLRESVRSWVESCELLAGAAEHGFQPHLETFGGCMMGQLCPPSLLIALSILEGMFFRQHGVSSISVSFAQQISPGQDEEAVRALRRLAAERLPDVDWHIVIYTYMGVYPRTPGGANRLLERAARLAVRTGSARLIVKTVAEAHRIPTIAENVAALETAAAAAATDQKHTGRLAVTADTGIYAEARTLVDAVLDLGPDIGRSLVRAFQRGYLDVPFCLHPDNAGRSRSYIAADGQLHWSRIGSMPIGGSVRWAPPGEMTAADLINYLSYVERMFDRPAVARSAPGRSPSRRPARNPAISASPSPERQPRREKHNAAG